LLFLLVTRHLSLVAVSGAGGGIRTHKKLPGFKSGAFASYATPARSAIFPDLRRSNYAYVANKLDALATDAIWKDCATSEMVREERLELSWTRVRGVLNPVRLPVPPFPLGAVVGCRWPVIGGRNLELEVFLSDHRSPTTDHHFGTEGGIRTHKACFLRAVCQPVAPLPHKLVRALRPFGVAGETRTRFCRGTVGCLTHKLQPPQMTTR
jgi:hypothetical protein